MFVCVRARLPACDDMGPDDARGYAYAMSRAIFATNRVRLLVIANDSQERPKFSKLSWSALQIYESCKLRFNYGSTMVNQIPGGEI